MSVENDDVFDRSDAPRTADVDRLRSGRGFGDGDPIRSEHNLAEGRKSPKDRKVAAAKRFVAMLQHQAIVAQEWNALAGEAMTMGLLPKWWRFRARRRWFRAAAKIIRHWQIWRDAHGEAV